MTATGQRYCLSRELPLSTADLFFPATVVISVSILGLVLIHRYIKHRRRQAHRAVFNTKPDGKQYSTLTSVMEKGDIASVASMPLSASDILRPLSQTSPLPSSGVLAAMARNEQRQRLDSSPTSASSPVEANSVQKSHQSIEQMHDEDVEGMRTWKRVVVEYR